MWKVKAKFLKKGIKRDAEGNYLGGGKIQKKN